MLSEENVLKAIIECMDDSHNSMFDDITETLKCDDFSLIPFIESLNTKHYTLQTSSYDIHVTDLGIEAYNRLFPSTSKKAKKILLQSSYNLTKFTIQRSVDIAIGIIIGVTVAAIANHFGWQ